MKSVLVLTLLFSTPLTMASTWVGNGGNAGDIELQVALNQIAKASKSIRSEMNEQDLCWCPEDLADHPLCAELRNLSDAQIKECAKDLKILAPDFLRLASSRDQMKIEWTHEPMSVLEGGRTRAADAVADPTSKRLSIHQERFLEMPSHQRLFLLAHEASHFLQIDGKYLVDEGPIGKFQGADGGRKHINALAASLALTAMETGVFDTDDSILKRSKGFMRRWIDFSSVNMGVNESSSSRFGQEKLNGTSLRGRYHWDDIGVSVEFQNVTGERSFLTSIKSKETRSLWAVGAVYRIFPFKDPLTFWGQSHFVLGAKYVQSSGTANLSDPFVELNSDAKSTGLGLDCSYYIPFRHGFWGFIQLSYLPPITGYPSLSVEYAGNPTTSGIGVSYGF